MNLSPSLTMRKPPVGLAVVALCAAFASLMAAPGLDGALGGALACLMLAIAAVDRREFVIPDALSGSAFALGLLAAEFAALRGIDDGAAWALIRAAAAAGALLAVRYFYSLWRGREGLGLGDVKLAGVAGVWLSPNTIAFAFELAALAALVAYGIQQWRRSQAFRPDAKLPFGAYLAPSIWMCWIFERLLDRFLM